MHLLNPCLRVPQALGPSLPEPRHPLLNNAGGVCSTKVSPV